MSEPADCIDDPPDDQSLASLTQCLQITWTNPGLLRQALVHGSVIAEARTQGDLLDVSHSNERLEFLGDAVVGLTAAELLYRDLADVDEGDLTVLRSNLIRRETLAGYARMLGLGDLLQMGRGMDGPDERNRVSVLAAAYEAVIGAIFLDQGYAAAASVVLQHMRDDVPRLLRGELGQNHKSLLQEISQGQYHIQPHYTVIERTGPPHDSMFYVQVDAGPLGQATGTGSSRQKAEQAAAAALLEMTRSS